MTPEKAVAIVSVLSAGAVAFYNVYQAYRVTEDLKNPFRHEEYEELQKGSGSFIDMTKYYAGMVGRQWAYSMMDDPNNW